tara:strand:- start:24 stop:371 length:348 start_codon:yes stop_codon:yes gene_type:complete
VFGNAGPGFDRFLWVVKQIPKGKVITYTKLIEVLGVSPAYYRVLPSYIRRPESSAHPVHRVVDSRGNLVQYIEAQQVRLEDEGIKVGRSSVDISADSWGAEKIYYQMTTDIENGV